MQILIDRPTIKKRVNELADQISRDYRGRPLVLLGILTGAAQFMMDLISAMADDIKTGLQYDFVDLTSYAGSQSSGQVCFLKDTVLDVTDRDVLIIDGIIDTGLTLGCLLEKMGHRSPRSLKVCALLDKTSRREHAIAVEYCGFPIDDVFVVGYGMDYNQQYRALPYIGLYDPANEE